MHTRHALLVALAVLAVPLAGALPQQAAPQAHANAAGQAGNTPATPADADDMDAASEDADEAADEAEHASNETADAADDEGAESVENASVDGPDADLPAHVPDHVQRIHTLIGQFLSGTLDGPLGPHISGVVRPGNGR